MNNDRILAICCHVGGLLGTYVFPLGNIIVPLVIWLIRRKEDELVNTHGRTALNFQITLTIYFIVSFILVIFGLISLNFSEAPSEIQIVLATLVLFGGFAIIFIPLMIIAEVILVIVASAKASNGEPYKYPRLLSIRFIK